MNMALGTLYGWSVFVAPLEKEFHWTRSQTSTAFTIAVTVFALTFILAGRLQDKLGPFSDCHHRRRAGRPGIFSMRIHAYVDLALRLFRRDWRTGQRFRIRCPDSCDGQVVSR